MPKLAAELDEFEQYLSQSFPEQGFIQSTARELIVSGGKRLRPALVLASAMTGEYDRKKAIPMAAAIETMHTATLVHDDVIDGAETRRGTPTMHMVHGNHVAIYTGDYLLARSLRMLSECHLPVDEMSKLAFVIEQICTGDISQYLGRSNVPGYRTYLKRILGKTGMLFAASCAGGGFVGQVDKKSQNRLWHFGMRLGAAFQIRDDLLDIDVPGNEAGKPTGRDLIEGIITLPILLATAHADYRKMLDNFLSGERSDEKLSDLICWARQLGTFDKSHRLLNDHLDRCRRMLDELPAGLGTEYLGRFVDMLEVKNN
jgi:heptaprenyl diphosphate synthase